jgi:ribosomal protein L11 methyltransferase
MSVWIEVQIEAAAAAAELIAAALTPLTGGVEMRDAETLLSTGPDRGAVIALCRPEALEEVLDELEHTLALARAGGTEVDPVTVRRREAHEEEWRDVWKQFFRATRVGQRFVVRPSWDPGPAPPGEHVIDLDPGRAFGTGAHPSTRLVIGFVEQMQRTVERFLDLGCGSGILSIVAARLWPQARGMAVDVDAEATACSRENFERNAVTTVELRTGDVSVADGSFDVVMANLQADVLEALSPALSARLAPRGALVVSGLLAPQVAAAQAAFERAGLRLEARADEGEWAALLIST